MCVAVCDESCEGFTAATSVAMCKLPGISNKTDIYLPNPQNLTTVDLRLVQVRLSTSLHQACEEGRLCVVQFILSQRPAAINTRDKLGRTPVMVAVMKRQVTVFDFLVGQNCDLMAVDNNNDTVLHVACQVGNANIVRNLVVNLTCDKEGRGTMGMTPVMKSALSGHRDVVELLVSEGCNVKTLDDNMNNILHVACTGGHVDMVKYVLRNLHADIESRGEKGRTPVMTASHSGHAGVVDFLVNKGANLSAVDDDGDNILHVACVGGHVDMVQHILKKTPLDIESKANEDRTPVMRASQYGQIAVVRFLISKHCNLTTVDGTLNNLLHVACIGGHLPIVKHILIKLKFPIDSRGQYGRTPVMIAAYYGHISIFVFLLNQGCKLAILDTKKDNTLHVACMGGHVNVVTYIVGKHIIGIESRGSNKRTAVMTSVLYGREAVAKYLIGKGCKLSVMDSKGNNNLHMACMSSSLDMVKYILSRTKIGIDSRGQHGQTPVMFAAYSGHTSVVKYLVRKGCKLSIVDSNGNNILHLTCMGGSLDMVKYILSRTKIGIDSRGQYGRTPVMFAAYGGHTSVVKYLVRKGCKLSIVDSNGNNILHLTCMGGSLDMAKYILSRTKIGIDSRGQYGRTPVMFAAHGGHTSIVKYLTRKRCNLSVVDSNGNNILHLTCMGGSLDMVKYIISRTKIEIDSRGQYGRTPVMFAAHGGHTSVVKYLLRKGCKLAIVDSTGNNILHTACMGGDVEMVKYILLQTKYGIDSRGQNGWTPVMFAAHGGHTSVVKYLGRKGCKLLMVDSTGSNILHTACMGGDVEMVKYILSRTKIGIDSRGQYGRTPVMTAFSCRQLSVVKYLISKGCKLLIMDSNANNILHVACMGGSLNMVKYILSRTKIEIDSRGQYGRTPVMYAAYFGPTSVVKYLVRKGCKLTNVDEKGTAVLEQACMGRHEDVVKYLITVKSWSKTCV